MRYAIITNPVAGSISVDRKRSILAKPAKILETEIYGLDTSTPEEFGRLARELADRHEVLVVAGGDGTLSRVINSLDTSRTSIGFLPLGSGNSMRYALGYRGSLADQAVRIREGQVHEYDLIQCDGQRRAFLASAGIEGTVLRIRDRYRARGARGLRAYLLGALVAYFKEYVPTVATIGVDGTAFQVKSLLTLMVVKQPYYGFGMKVIPKAQFDDHLLHILFLSSGLLEGILGVLTSFTIGNKCGKYITGRHVDLKLERPLTLQIDGDRAWDADNFTFTVLPGALRVKY